MISLARSVSATIQSSASLTSPSSGGCLFKKFTAARALLRAVAMGWVISWTTDAACSPMMPRRLLCALALRHIDVCTDNLDDLSARGEQMVGSCRQIFCRAIGEYDSELARVILALAQCILELLPYPVSIVWVDPLPHSFAAWNPLKRI